MSRGLILFLVGGTLQRSNHHALQKNRRRPQRRKFIPPRKFKFRKIIVSIWGRKRKIEKIPAGDFGAGIEGGGDDSRVFGFVACHVPGCKKRKKEFRIKKSQNYSAVPQKSKRLRTRNRIFQTIVVVYKATAPSGRGRR
jgi:hypothetical protein